MDGKPWLTIVGIGEDGVAGLGAAARQAVMEALVILGGERHLAMLPPDHPAERLVWPSPFAQAVSLVQSRRGTPLCILASGDPMHFGIGASLARHIAAAEMRVLPGPSSLSLAAARMGWALQDAIPVSLVGRPLAGLHAQILPGARLLVLCEDRNTPSQVAAMLTAAGYGASPLSLLEHLGGPHERRVDDTASAWDELPGADLAILAVQCVPESGVARWPRLAGLPDDAFRHDGQLTKRDVRAATLARLAPAPGELLWDIGAGCGSISIEWLRSDPSCRALAVEADAARRELIAANAAALGVPGLEIVAGQAPAVLSGLRGQPDAVFIGGGVMESGMLEACWDRLKPGGRLVANAVTVQSEALLVGWREKVGGELVRIAVSHAAPLGRFDAWRNALPVTIYAGTKG